jgi:Enoyl-(Acyl carrier protein) reductase
MAPEEARRGLTEHLLLALEVARGAADKVRAPGSLVFMGGTGARRPRAGLAIASTVTVALPTLIASLALEMAPIRVNLIAAGFVDTPLSASILGVDLDKRREELRRTLPIGRVVGPADVAALAIHLMTNTALTGATYDVDGGQALVSEYVRAGGRRRRRCGPRVCRSVPERTQQRLPAGSALSCPTSPRCTPASTRARRRRACGVPVGCRHR